MKYSIVVVKHLLLFTALGIAACSSGSNDTLPKYRTVEGAVVKAPISNATIDIFEVDRAGQAIPPPIATITSDSNGAFSIPNLPQGVYLARSRGGQFTDESDPSGERVVTLTQSQGFETLIPVGATTATITPFTQILVDKLRRQAIADDVPFESLIEGGRDVFKAAFGFDILTTIPSNPIAPQPGVSKPILTSELNYAMALGGFAQAVNAIALELKNTATSFEIIQQYIKDLSDGLENGAAETALNVAGVPLPVAHINEQINRFRNNNDAAYSEIPSFVIQLLRIADPAARDPSIVDPTPSPTVSPSPTPPPAIPTPTTTPDAGITPTPIATTVPTPTPETTSTPTPTPDATTPPPASPMPAAPVAQNSSVTTDENQAITGQLQASDSNSDPLTYSVISPPGNGSLNLTSSTGSFTYTPNTYFDGSDSFSFQANDGNQSSNTATVTVNVLDTITPFHLVEFGSGYAAEPTIGAASLVNSARVTIVELSGSGSSIQLSDDDAITTADRLLVDNALFTADGTNYVADYFDQLATSTGKSTVVSSKALRSRTGDENAFGILSIRQLFDEGVASSSAFYDWPTTQRLFPGSVGQYSGTAFFQAEDYQVLNNALYSNFKRPELIRGENALDLLIPLNSSAGATSVSGNYGLVKLEIRFSTDGSGESHTQTEMLGLPLVSNIASGTATIFTTTDIFRTPSNNGTQGTVTDNPESSSGPDTIGEYLFSITANGALQIDFDRNGDGSIQPENGEISALGAIDPTQEYFAAAFANNSLPSASPSPQTIGVLAGVKRFQGSLAGSSMQDRKFVIHGLENLSAKTSLETSRTHLRHGSLTFSNDGTTATLQSAPGDEATLARDNDAENYYQITSSLFSNSSGTVIYGVDGDISINFNTPFNRVLRGFVSEDLQSLVLSSTADDAGILGSGIFIASEASTCRDNPGCNLDNLPPYPQPDFRDIDIASTVDGSSQSASQTPGKASVVSVSNYGFEGGSEIPSILDNGESIDLNVTFNETDTGRENADIAPISISWTSTAGTFGPVNNEAVNDSPSSTPPPPSYSTRSSTTWTAPSSGSGRTYLTAVASDGDFEAIYRVETAWGLDGDEDGLLDDEETQVYGTDKTKADTDGDNLKDGYEVVVFNSDPKDLDSDDDDVHDGFENRYSTSPNSQNDVIHVDQNLTGCVSGDGMTWSTAYCGQSEVEALLGERQSQFIYTPLYILYNAGEYRALSINSTQNIYAIGSVGPSDLTPRGIDTEFRGSGSVRGKVSGCPGTAGSCSVVALSSSNELGLSNIRLFDGYNPGAKGGGLNISNSYSVQLDDLQIDSNLASYGGGLAIDSSSSDIYLRNSQVFSNQAIPDSASGNAGRGGGVYSLGENLVVQNTQIGSNSASTDDALASDANARGGGIYLQHSGSGSGYDSTRIENSELEYNTVQGYGGGIYLDTPGPSCVTLKESRIRGNRAEFAFGSGPINGGASGGGVWWGSESDCISSFTPDAGTIFGNEISANYADDNNPLQGGGGIYAATGSKILHNSIVGNMSYGQGGGILLTSSQSTAGTQQLFNNLIASNYAKGNGGGVAFLDQYDSGSNAHTLESNSIVSNATGGPSSLGAGLYIHPVDETDASAPLVERVSLIDNLIIFNTEAGTSPSTDNIECRITDENNSSVITDCCNGSTCSGPLAVNEMLANAFGDNADEIPAAASDSDNQVKPGGSVTGYTTFSNPFLVGGFRLDQANSSLIDMASGSTPDCDFAYDCSTNVTGDPDTSNRDIGMHFKDPADQPAASIDLDAGPFGGTGADASDCAFVGFDLLLADGSSAGSEHIVSAQIDTSSASPSVPDLYIRSDHVASPPPEAPAGSVLAQNLGNGEYFVYVCNQSLTCTGNGEDTYSDLQLIIQADEETPLPGQSLSINFAEPASCF